VEAMLERLRATIEQARSMPMSSSAVIHRAEVLAQIDEIKAALPAAFAESDRVFTEREQMLLEAKEQADRIVVEATNEHERLVSDSEVYRVAKHQADGERQKAAAECETLRRETDEYVDRKLANLEITLTKTLEAVTRGRDRLHGRSDLERLDELAEDDTGFPFAGRHSGSSI
jgi:cell division septum initiation protein DivIVA